MCWPIGQYGRGRLQYCHSTGNETKISRYRVVFFKDRNIAGYFSSLYAKNYFTGTVLWIETSGSDLKPKDQHWNQWIRTKIRIETNGSALVSIRTGQDPAFFAQIRIQHLSKSGSRVLTTINWKKIYSCQKNFNLIKSCNLPYLSLGLHNDIQTKYGTGKYFTQQNHIKHLKPEISSLLWVIFPPRSGSSLSKKMRIRNRNTA